MAFADIQIQMGSLSNISLINANFFLLQNFHCPSALTALVYSHVLSFSLFFRIIMFTVKPDELFLIQYCFVVLMVYVSLFPNYNMKRSQAPWERLTERSYFTRVAIKFLSALWLYILSLLGFIRGYSHIAHLVQCITSMSRKSYMLYMKLEGHITYSISDMPSLYKPLKVPIEMMGG